MFGGLINRIVQQLGSGCEMDEKDILTDHIIKLRLNDAQAIIEQWIKSNGGQSLFIDLIEPILADIGERYNNRQISLAQIYIAAKIARDWISRYEKELETNELNATKGPVVIANIEDDCHPLGRRLVCSFLRVSGWNVCDLGIDVPIKEIVNKAVEIEARVIGVSAMIYTTAENIRTLKDEIITRNLDGKIKIAAGGAVFRLRPELVAEVGADGTSMTASEAPELFDRLWKMTL